MRDAYDWIAELVKQRAPVRKGMQQLAQQCNERCPHSQWQQLVDCDFEADVQLLGRWLNDTLEHEPPAPEIRALWFGLFQPIVNGKATCGLYVSGARGFFSDQGAGDWDWTGRYWPEARYAQSGYLRHVYSLAYARDGLGNSAEYALALGYTSLALVALAQGECSQSLLGRARERALAAGFDSGDTLFLGNVTRNGLAPLDYDAHRKPRPPADPATALYEIVEPRSGRWWLQSIRSPNGEHLPGGFGETGAIETIASAMAQIRDKGERADFNEPVLGPPVVRREVAAVIESLAPGAVQRIPVRIGGDDGDWDILNVTFTVSWTDLLQSVPSATPKPWRSQSPVRIARILPYPGPIAVHAQIKQELEARKVSGLRFEPLGQSHPWRYLGLPTLR